MRSLMLGSSRGQCLSTFNHLSVQTICMFVVFEATLRRLAFKNLEAGIVSVLRPTINESREL